MAFFNSTPRGKEMRDDLMKRVADTGFGWLQQMFPLLLGGKDPIEQN